MLVILASMPVEKTTFNVIRYIKAWHNDKEIGNNDTNLLDHYKPVAQKL